MIQSGLIEVRQAVAFNKWLGGLRDDEAQACIVARLDRLARGNWGDVKSVGRGVSELLIDYGPGYRLYYTRRGKVLVLLCGGDKRTQARDIKRAQKIAEELE